MANRDKHEPVPVAVVPAAGPHNPIDGVAIPAVEPGRGIPSSLPLQQHHQTPGPRHVHVIPQVLADLRLAGQR